MLLTFAIIGCVAACCAILGFIFGLAKWAAKIDLNTAATDKLTGTFETFVAKVGDTLENHNTRITRLETKAEYYQDGHLRSVTRTEEKPE